MTYAAGDIQRRLRSMEDIRHLLRSVRGMSAIRWRRARARLRSSQRYAAAVDRQLALATTVSTALTRGVHRPAEEAPGVSRSIGLIALTSDQGLCGTFNIGLVGHALDFIERERAKGKKVKVISLGGYGERFFREADCELLYTQRFPLTHAVSFVEARDIVAKVKQFYEEGAFDTLHLTYNQFESFGRYQWIEVRLLPPDLQAIWSSVQEASPDGRMPVPEDLIWGTSAQDLQEFLLWEHLAVQVYLGLIESMVSEQGARLQTMDAAINNLDERVEQLQLQYHAIRQEGITREVLQVQSNIRARRS
jgi:F-type H+-transporting ATPase subunit gamma